MRGIMASKRENFVIKRIGDQPNLSSFSDDLGRLPAFTKLCPGLYANVNPHDFIFIVLEDLIALNLIHITEGDQESQGGWKLTDRGWDVYFDMQGEPQKENRKMRGIMASKRENFVIKRIGDQPNLSSFSGDLGRLPAFTKLCPGLYANVNPHDFIFIVLEDLIALNLIHITEGDQESQGGWKLTDRGWDVYFDMQGEPQNE